MTLQIMPVDTTKLEFRYHGATAFHEYDRDTNKRSTDQARDPNTGYPIFTVRCQVLYRTERQAGMIAVRVPLSEPPSEDLEFEHPVSFSDVTAKSWNMDGRDGQTWTAAAMSVAGAQAAPPAPPTETRKAKASANTAL